jgi:3-deoxy-7-phosphoheptulonate synthase
MIVVIKSQTPASEIERIIQELHRYPLTVEKVVGKRQSCHWLSG